MNKFLSIGFGNVGRAIPERAEAELGLKQKKLVIRSGGVYRLKADGAASLVDARPDFWQIPDVMKDVKIAFNTLPSDQGGRSLEILKQLASRGIPVITAEKGALSQFYRQIKNTGLLDFLGSDATVGGRTGMLGWSAGQINSRTTQIHVVINGTLNYILDGISNQRTPGQVIDEAVLLGYAEPGATEHLEVLNGELVGDIPKKAAILANQSLRNTVFLNGSYLLPRQLEQAPLDSGSWHRLIREAKDRRYILSFIRKSQEIPEDDIIAPLRKEIKTNSGVTVVLGGFRRVHDNPLLSYLNLSGTRNGAVITGGNNESDGILVLSGEGAGPGPTATAMVNNARQFLK
ncbi:MAG TPA: hypothetical protein VFX79_00965 [Candidatus Saccharimonadales bacterium]|nr:hypothetical protein [Candidatus Saccharimonadales bacterium]